MAGDGGGVIVEAILVMPIIFALMCAVLEYGNTFRLSQTVSFMLQVGGRTASIAMNHPNADELTIARMHVAAATLPSGAVQRIVLWRATDDGSGVAWRKGPLSVVPPVCQGAASGNVAELCNVYSRTADTLNPTSASTSAWSDCTKASNPSRFWCSTTRKTAVQGPNGPPDMIGVYLEVVQAFVTGLFGSSVVVVQQGVFALEPGSLS